MDLRLVSLASTVLCNVDPAPMNISLSSIRSFLSTNKQLVKLTVVGFLAGMGLDYMFVQSDMENRMNKKSETKAPAVNKP